MKRKRTWFPDDPYPYLLTFRVAIMRGRYGGGKTALAVYWASRLIADGYARRVFANIPLTIPRCGLVAEYPSRPPHWPEDAAILYDEAWLDLGIGAPPATVKAFLAYLRKSNCYLLLPSVLPLARTVVGLTVERVFNGYVYGMPFWWYHWELPARSEMGTMMWRNPKQVFGWYDTAYRPTERWWLYEVR